MIMIKKN